MQLFLSKLIPVFVMPLGLVFILLFFTVVLVVFDKRKSAILFCFLQIVLLGFSSSPVVSGFLVGYWERTFTPVSVENSEPADLAIVLGGSVGGVQPPRVEENLGDGADRVLRASRLYREGKVKAVIVSGGNIPWMGVLVPEAEVMKNLLMEWGVPAEAILVEDASRNTRENAVYVQRMMADLDFDTALLVTSALHMPRALAVFRKAGVHVEPSPCDYLVVDKEDRVVMDYLPDAGALNQTTNFLREMVGMVYYKINGWI